MKRIALLVAAGLLPLHAAAVYECNVKVHHVLIYKTGMINVLHSGRGNYTMICSLDAQYGPISPTTCAMWTATLLAVKKKNGTAAFYFDGDGSCETMPTYGNAPVPHYVGDVTTP